MKLRPYRDLCLVLLDEPESTIPSTLDLVLPDACQFTPETGEVIEVGNECRHVKVGERVRFGKRNGWRIDDALCHRLGHPPGRLYLMRPCVEKEAAVYDHIHLIEEHAS